LINKDKIAELFFLTVITAAAFVLYYFIQPVLTYATCKLCDGGQYAAMYSYFKGNASVYSAAFPYYSRAMVPFLASLIPTEDIYLNFQIVNMLFSIAGVIAIYCLWKALDIPVYLILIGLFWLLFHWTGLIRLNAFDPLTVDVPTYLFQTLLLFIILSKRYNWLYLLGPLAVLQRESILILLLVLLIFAIISNYVFKTGEKLPVVMLVLAIILTVLTKYIYTRIYPAIDITEKSSVRLVLFYIKEVVFDPFKIIRWIVGVFMAYGVFLVLASIKVKKDVFSSSFMLILSFMSAIYLLLGIIAGGDSTRIVFLGFPFIMTWILIVLKEVNVKLTILALVLSVFLMKLVGTIPDPGKDFHSYAQWYPEFATSGTVLIWGAYLIVCCLFLYFINRLFIVK
jgi:hypothetical protein